MTVLAYSFKQMVSIPNLFCCWQQFKRHKRKKKEVQLFERHLEDHIFHLGEELRKGEYSHGDYQHFRVFDPKERHISKTSVRDRLVHHVVYNELVRFFDKRYVYHSFSCRLGKGTHKGVSSLERALRKVSANNTRPCYVLKIDIKRFFDTICHPILKKLIKKHLKDQKILTLIDHIIDSFYHKNEQGQIRGLPLGNVTSQVFANIYLHELDVFVKHQLKEPFYLRFCDDFCLVGESLNHLESLNVQIRQFLKDRLLLEIHPGKTIDFLGYVLFPHHKLLRTRTRKRLKNRLNKTYEDFLNGKVSIYSIDQTLHSYLGILAHANEYDFSLALKNSYLSREEKMSPFVSKN